VRTQPILTGRAAPRQSPEPGAPHDPRARQPDEAHVLTPLPGGDHALEQDGLGQAHEQAPARHPQRRVPRAEQAEREGEDGDDEGSCQSGVGSPPPASRAGVGSARPIARRAPSGPSTTSSTRTTASWASVLARFSRAAGTKATRTTDPTRPQPASAPPSRRSRSR